MKTPPEIYSEIVESGIPLLPYAEIRAFSSSEWDRAVKQIPSLFTLRLAIEAMKRRKSEQQMQFAQGRVPSLPADEKDVYFIP